MNSASAGLVKVRSSPPNGASTARRRSTFCGSRLAMTVIHGLAKSSAAETARRNSGFEASPKPSLATIPEFSSRVVFTRPSVVPGGDGGADDDRVLRVRAGEGAPDGGGAGGERGQVVAVPVVRGGQGQEDQRLGLVGQVDRGACVPAAVAQLADPYLGDVDERDIVAGLQETLTGRGAHDAGAHDENPALHGLFPLLTIGSRAGKVYLGPDGHGGSPPHRVLRDSSDDVVHQDQFDPPVADDRERGRAPAPRGRWVLEHISAGQADPRCGRCQLPMKSSGVAPPPDGSRRRESRSVVSVPQTGCSPVEPLRDKHYLNRS